MADWRVEWLEDASSQLGVSLRLGTAMALAAKVLGGLNIPVTSASKGEPVRLIGGNRV
jgi:hypothetical protein